MTNPIEEAKQYAREAIRETWPTVEETTQASPSAYEYDEIHVDDEECEVASISIMHDPDADTFALVENPRLKPTTAPKSSGKPTATKTGSEIDWDKLQVDHAIAYLRGDLAISSPQSYSLEEMKEICAGMVESTAEIDAALKADFETLPPEAQGMLLDMLCESGCMTPEFWKETLLGTMPNSVDGA